MRIVAFASLFVVLVGCQDPSGNDDEQAESPSLRELVLDHAPTESASVGLFSTPGATTREVLARLNEIRTDDKAKGVFLRIGPFGSGWARSADVARGLNAIRAAHKPVHCYFETADNASYALLAAACDRITMTPAGDLDLVGVAAHVFHGRQLLESLGIRAELMQMGRFKGASEPFTRDDMSPEARETTSTLLDDLQNLLVSNVAEGRHLDAARVRTIIDQGPYDSSRAEAAHLVDAVAFVDQARDAAKAAAHVQEVKRVRLRDEGEHLGLSDIIKAFTEDHEEEESEGPRVALVVLEGSISDGEGRAGDLGASVPFVRTFERIAEDADVKAVVLRIDSPGGSALASDVMWHAVQVVAAKKPVIISIGDMAASGGYYIACAGTRIFAEDESIVGSIGVVGGKINAADLLTRIGVHAEVITRGANAGWNDPTRGFSDSERAVMQGLLQATYDRFLSRVREGRHLDEARTTAAAEGRIWSAQRARTLGLVDEIGGLEQAIAHARAAAHLPADARVQVWPKQGTIVDVISRMLGADTDNEEDVVSLMDLASHIAPGIARIRPLQGVLSGRERTAVTLPFSLEIH